MNVYVATASAYRADAAALARRLRALDIHVVSRWHDALVEGEDESVAEGDLPEDVLDRIAAGNHRDLGRADTLALLLRPKMAGALLELGFAMGAGHRVLVVGERRKTTVMARHDRTWWCATENACVETLGRLAGRGRP